MIRLILIALIIVLFLILSIPILGVEYLIGKSHPQKADLQQLRLIQGIFRFILFVAGAKVTVIGEENVPKDEPVLYVANHRSYFDVVSTYSRCPGLTGYIAKYSMHGIPLLSVWMKRLHCLFIDRSNVKNAMKTILAGIDLIKNGVSVFIFPEGTRNRSDQQMLPFKEGSFKIAEKTGCAIVPVAILGSAEIFENHIPFVKAGHITLEYGKPIYPKTLDKENQKKIGAYCQHILEDMLNHQ